VTLCHPGRPLPRRFRQSVALTTGLTACAVTLPGQPRFDLSGARINTMPAGGPRPASRPLRTARADNPGSCGEGAIAVWASQEHRTAPSHHPPDDSARLARFFALLARGAVPVVRRLRRRGRGGEGMQGNDVDGPAELLVDGRRRLSRLNSITMARCFRDCAAGSPRSTCCAVS